MKPLHLPLFVVGMLVPFLLTAQSLHLTGSVPSTQSANVQLTTMVSFTFDQPLQPGTASLDSIGEQFIVIPNDKIVIHQMDMTPDGRSLVFAVSHMAEVDYTWIFFGLQSTTGQTMTDFNIVSYTTAQTTSPVSVQGHLMVPDSPEPVTFSSTVVMLMRDLSFMNEQDGGGPENDMLYATIPDATTGAYSFNAVKPGSYYVLAMMFTELRGRMDPIRVGIHRNAMQEPIPLILSTTSVTGLDLVMEVSDMGPTDPIDAVQAFQYVESIMSVDLPTAEPIVMEGYPADMPANGDADVWMVAYFNDADSIVTMLWTDGFRITNRETMHLMSMPENERPPVDLATIKPIPNEFVSSRAAYQVALQNGLSADMATYSPVIGEVWQNVNYRLAHFYFEFPDLMTVDSNPYWMIRYQVHTPMGGLELMYLVDALTGTFIARVERQEQWNPGGFELVSADPSSLTANLPLQTRVAFTFSEPVNIGTLNLESRRITWTVLPEDRIQLHQMSYSEDFKTVFVDVTLTADTDYVWSFQGIRSTNGSALNTAEVVNHTTKASVSPLIIAGSLIWPDPTLAPHPDQAMSVVMLLDSPDYFLNGMNGPPTGIINVGVGLPDSWRHTMENVRPGTYYPAAFVFDKASGGATLIAFGFLPDLNDAPRSITITDQSFTQFNIPLWYTDPNRERPLVDAAYAFAKAEARMATLNPQARLIAIEGRSRRMPPSGDAQDWSVIYFSEADSMVTRILAGQRMLVVDSFHYLSMPPNERVDVDLSTIKSIPDEFVRSRTAFQTAIQNGLSNDVARFAQTNNQAMEIHYNLGHFYWEYPEFTNVDSNPFWDIQFSVYSQTGMFEATYLVDAVTGNLIARIERNEPWTPTNFELMGTNPGHMSSGVPLQTEIRFTFSEPIRPETVTLQSQMQTWGVMPADKISIQLISYTDNNRTVVMQVIHQTNTDYVWYFDGVLTQDGGRLRTAEVVNYTTESSVSPLAIDGSMVWPDPQNIPSPDGYMALVILLDSPDYFLSGMEGPPPGIRNIGSTEPGTWMFRVANVRPGTYYPAVFVFDKGMEGNSLLAYGFLPDQNGLPRSLTLTDQTVSGLQLSLWYAQHEGEHHPIDVSSVIDMVRGHVTSQGNGAELITLFGREEIYRPVMPNGMSFDWGFIFYETATDTVQMMQVSSTGIFAIDRFHVSSVPEEERIPKELVQPLPGNFISSAQAMNTAMGNGLADLIQTSPEGAWMQVRYDLSRFYFRHPGILTSDAPPFWEIQFNAELMTMDQQLLWAREAIFLVDATNGAFIHKTVTTGLDDEDRALAFELDQNVPNPFNPTTVIGFSVGTQDLASLQVTLTVYDILGRQVAVLVDGMMPAGSHHVTFDGTMLPSGVYLYRLESGGKSLQRKFTLVK